MLRPLYIFIYFYFLFTVGSSSGQAKVDWYMVVRLTPRQPVLPLDGESPPWLDGVAGRKVAKVAREVGGGKKYTQDEYKGERS